MKKKLPLFILAMGCALLVVATAGCKTVARENIISSINTGIGITVAENPKTEMYEVKIGYIRSQFYSVPTGKTVENENPNGANYSNAANLTPEVVSGIRMHSGIQQLLIGLDVSESFAVGPQAVMSPAAVAMYIADADSSAKAVAAAGAAEATAKSLGTVRTVDAPGVSKKKLEISAIHERGPADKAKVETAIARPENGGFTKWNDFLRASPSDAQLDAILKEIK